MKYLNDSKMPLSRDLQLKLSKRHEPNSLLTSKYKGNDIMFKTDEDGNAVFLFIGQMTKQGKIKGERYARTLKMDIRGDVIKDHWELKGKAS
jgi:hypothetical protein